MLIFKSVGVKVRWDNVGFYGFTIGEKAWLAVFQSSSLSAFLYLIITIVAPNPYSLNEASS